MPDLLDQISTAKVAESPTAASQSATSRRSRGAANDCYQIDFSTRLKELDSFSGKAYAAMSKENPSAIVYALVCEPGMPVRYQAYLT
jgi:hypothetical protein